MNLLQRIALLERLGTYMTGNEAAWAAAKQKAHEQNGWFLPAFINLSAKNIAQQFLHSNILNRWISHYPQLQNDTLPKKTIGIVMAGNIPLVGFHDFLCVFISGHTAFIKPSSKDETLLKHLVDKMTEWEPKVAAVVQFHDMLKGCDAYIATGSNNSAGYFEYYFSRYPHIIRKNKTSVAVLTGYETEAELDALADDVFLYYGMGCRNVTKIYVPNGYVFTKLINRFSRYNYLADNSKYKNNLDYNLALHVLNNKFYMSTEALLLVEEPSVFSPVSQLNYGFYTDAATLLTALKANNELQCIVGNKAVPFGEAQCPNIMQYADGVDTLQFLLELK